MIRLWTIFTILPESSLCGLLFFNVRLCICSLTFRSLQQSVCCILCRFLCPISFFLPIFLCRSQPLSLLSDSFRRLFCSVSYTFLAVFTWLFSGRCRTEFPLVFPSLRARTVFTSTSYYNGRARAGGVYGLPFLVERVARNPRGGTENRVAAGVYVHPTEGMHQFAAGGIRTHPLSSQRLRFEPLLLNRLPQ